MAAPEKHGKLVEILQICLLGQPEDIYRVQHPNRSHTPVQSGRFQGNSQRGCVAGRSLLWVPWMETFASVGLVRAGAFEFIPCENDLQASSDASWKDRHSLQTLGSISIKERFMDNKRKPL